MLPPLSYYNKDPAPIHTLCWAWSSYRVYQYTSQTSLAWYTLCLYRELPTLLVILRIWSHNCFITNFLYISVSSSVPCISINFRFPIASNERSGPFTKAIKLWIFDFKFWTHRTHALFVLYLDEIKESWHKILPVSWASMLEMYQSRINILRSGPRNSVDYLIFSNF